METNPYSDDDSDKGGLIAIRPGVQVVVTVLLVALVLVVWFLTIKDGQKLLNRDQKVEPVPYGFLDERCVDVRWSEMA